MLTLRRGPKKAFTLLELIVVIVVLGLLAALAIPTFARVTKRSQDASTSTTVAAVLRDARALMAFQDKGYTWEEALGTAAAETAAPAAAGLSAAGIGLDKVSTDPSTTARGTFQVLGTTDAPTGVLLALRSKSDNVCVGVATLTSASTPFCAPTADAAALVAGATSVSGAVLSGGVSGVQLPSGVTPVSLVTAPAAPTGVVATATAGGAKVTWTASVVANAPVTGYRVTATPTTGGAVVTTTTSSASALSADLAPLTAGATYSVVVEASYSGGHSDKSTPVSVVPLSGSYSGGSSLRTVAGSATLNTGEDGTGTAASFKANAQSTTDGTYLYVADFAGNKIRKVNPTTGEVTTLAGSGAQGGFDATGTAATFDTPWGLATDGTYLYVSEFYGNKIRKVSLATGAVTTLAGTGTSGFRDGAGPGAQFNNPRGITLVGTTLYVADESNYRIRTVSTASGAVGTFFGNGTSSTTDSSVLYDPLGLSSDGAYLYVSDVSAIRRIDLATKASSILAGSLSTPGSTDSTGAAARFNGVQQSVVIAGSLYVADTNNSRVRVVNLSTGVVTTLTTSINAPRGVVELKGSLLVTGNKVIASLS
jgi:prepilin-type N-terminal cleavage/methylation domain-containing protein